ncbi:MAG: chromosome segregation protein SMC [Bacillota bacterium]|nr:chromosome segregation protein SMC [Bacillota bacterium]
MYFKSLQLHGFKSFADKTKLDFDDGVTAVVGPNGSGKSNISDALRWVMGEMSVKSLRGSKMEDVIFNGTDKRTPMAYAEVSIIIDNTDRSLNMDFDEITVTRRVYRSGESEYSINKASCRLKDIHELFMDTGLGRDGYSVVGQGKIDEILSARSEDRRHIFDEAAGITKYRYKKDEAERKLLQTTDNLFRVEDILTEIGNNLTPLEHQSRKAKKYLQLRETQKNLEINLWLKSLDSFDEQLTKIEENHKIAFDNQTRIESAIKDEESYLVSKKESYRHLEGMIDENRANVYSQKNEITRISGEIEIARTNIENYTKEISRLRGEISIHKEKVAQLKKDIQEKKISNSALYDNHKEIELLCGSLAQEQENITNLISEMNTRIKVLREQLAEKQNEISSNSAKIESSAGYFESLRERLTDLMAKKSASAMRREEIEAEIGLSEDNLRSIADKVKTDRETSEKFFNELETLKEKVSNKGSELDELSVEKKSLEHKKITLEALENSFDGYPHSVKAIMNEVRHGALSTLGIHGPLSQIINTERKYVTAIEAALGGALNYIATDTENDAKEAIEYLKRTKSGRATFLPISSVKGSLLSGDNFKNANGFIGIACELVQFDPKFRDIITAQLGRTVVIDNIDNAIKLARENAYKYKIVTLSGEVLSVGGSVSGGSSRGSSNSLSRNAEIELIVNQIDKISSQKNEFSALLEDLNKKLSETQKQCNEIQEKTWQNKSLLITEKSRLENLQLSLHTEKDNIQTLEKETDKINEIINAANLSNKNMISGNESMQIQVSELESKILSLESEIEFYSSKLAEVTEKSGEARTDKALSLKDIETGEIWVKDAENQVVSDELEISQKAIHAEALEEDIFKLENNIVLYKTKIEELKNSSSESEGSIDLLSRRREAEEKEIAEKELLLKEFNENIYKIREELARIEGKKLRLEETREDILTKMWEEYELTYSSADSLRSDIGAEADAQKQLGTVKSNIRALGNINIDSIEEYSTQKERFDFLSSQKKDLEEAKASLNNLISEMTVIMTEMFEENFTKLNKQFGETFSDLFGGGKAGIRLSDPEDILGSGVEIEVQPPGKKLQSITLLSGGEKAFTAIALIFAILKIKPTCFCIFDEIEAALDDVNVFRYADYLRKFAQDTQFILITHRKGTMEIADTLYGVTMQEKGVTTLISLDLDKYNE